MERRLLLLEAGIPPVQPVMLRLKTGAEGSCSVVHIADGCKGCRMIRADPVQSASLKPEPSGRAATRVACRMLDTDQYGATDRKQGAAGACTLQVAEVAMCDRLGPSPTSCC